MPASPGAPTAPAQIAAPGQPGSVSQPTAAAQPGAPGQPSASGASRAPVQPSGPSALLSPENAQLLGKLENITGSNPQALKQMFSKAGTRPPCVNVFDQGDFGLSSGASAGKVKSDLLAVGYWPPPSAPGEIVTGHCCGTSAGGGEAAYLRLTSSGQWLPQGPLPVDQTGAGAVHLDLPGRPREKFKHALRSERPLWMWNVVHAEPGRPGLETMLKAGGESAAQPQPQKAVSEQSFKSPADGGTK